MRLPEIRQRLLLAKQIWRVPLLRTKDACEASCRGQGHAPQVLVTSGFRASRQELRRVTFRHGPS